jgi:hypothetical protein
MECIRCTRYPVFRSLDSFRSNGSSKQLECMTQWVPSMRAQEDRQYPDAMMQQDQLQRLDHGKEPNSMAAILSRHEINESKNALEAP